MKLPTRSNGRLSRRLNRRLNRRWTRSIFERAVDVAPVAAHVRVAWLGRVMGVVLASLMLCQTVGAQTLSYTSGQNISPGYEGWEEDADGSRWFVFGYMNRNWDEEPHIPVGPDNSMEPGGPDHGQPTRFLPRRNRFVFRVPVPDDFESDDELVWTLTVNGVTERAYATLRPDYFMDAMIRASEHGAIGAGFTDDTIRANKMPLLSVEGKSTRTVRVGQPLTLRATASDDGVPESPRKLLLTFRPDALNPWVPHQRGTVNSETGLRVSWFVYRGDGTVMFDPAQIKVWEDTRTGTNSPWAPHWVTPVPPEDGMWTTDVTFETAGTYVLRCRASDGALDVDHDVTVTVAP